MGEGWRQEDQKFKAILNYKASRRSPGRLETLLETNKTRLRLSHWACGLVGRDGKKAWLARCWGCAVWLSELPPPTFLVKLLFFHNSGAWAGYFCGCWELMVAFVPHKRRVLRYHSQLRAVKRAGSHSRAAGDPQTKELGQRAGVISSLWSAGDVSPQPLSSGPLLPHA